jgi:hypothetical protein
MLDSGAANAFQKQTPLSMISSGRTADARRLENGALNGALRALSFGRALDVSPDSGGY